MAQPTVMSCTWIEGGGREGKRDKLFVVMQ